MLKNFKKKLPLVRKKNYRDRKQTERELREENNSLRTYLKNLNRSWEKIAKDSSANTPPTLLPVSPALSADTQVANPNPERGVFTNLRNRLEIRPLKGEKESSLAPNTTDHLAPRPILSRHSSEATVFDEISELATTNNEELAALRVDLRSEQNKYYHLLDKVNNQLIPEWDAVKKENQQLRKQLRAISNELAARPNLTLPEYQKLCVEQEKALILERHLAVLRQQYKTAQAQLQAQETQLADYQLRKESYEQQIIDLQAEPAQTKRQHEQELVLTQQANRELQHQLNNVEHLLETKEQQITSLTQENERLNVINNERERERERDENDLIEQTKKELITQIVQNCGLNVNHNSTLDQVINTLQALINKPPLTLAVNQRVAELEKQSAEKPKQPPALSSENLTTIKEIDLEILAKTLTAPWSTETTKQLAAVNNYHQWAVLRNELLTQHLTVQQQEQLQTLSQAKTGLIKRQEQERIVLGTILMSGLLAMLVLAKKLKQTKSQNQKYRQGYQEVKAELAELRKEMQVLIATLLQKGSNN